jgi:hypothetical protein
MSGADDREAVAAVERLAHSCVEVLETPVVSSILHGSLTLDDFRDGRSDLDLLLVVDGHLATDEGEALVAVVRDADPGPAGTGIDLTVVTREAAAAPAPRLELHVGRYDDSSAELEVDSRDDNWPDLWAELSMARADGRALEGAEPGDVIGLVPPEAVRDRGVYWLTVWLDRTDDEANASLMVLTACRIWRFAVQGRHSSKTSAGRWVLDRDPSLVAVEQALAERDGEPDATIDPDEIRRVLVTVLQHVEG